MSNLVKISTKAPTPLMIPAAAAAFERLREAVLLGTGVDFLAKCGDVSRPAGFRSNKDGVANRSWHKTGRAFDYDQTAKALAIVSEPLGGKQYFRTYLKCYRQDGSQGNRMTVHDLRGFNVTGDLFDFTAAAETVLFKRIPAWSGWQSHYNRKEFWHYQYNPENLTWDAAMRQLAGAKDLKPENSTYGRNDRGPEVESIQAALFRLGLIAQREIDGVFGVHTYNAVRAFQVKNKLNVDGLVGPNTRKALGL